MYIHRFKKLIRQTDIFGQPIQFNLKNKSQHQTLFGGFVSILTVIFVILLCQRQAIRLFALEDFKLQIQDNIVKVLAKKNITTDNFSFGVKIQDSNVNGNKKFFDLMLEQRYYIKNNINSTSEIKKVTKVIPLIKCTIEHFNNIDGYSLDQVQICENIYQSLINFDLDSYLCPPLNETLELEGFIKIYIVQCKNANECETQEKLNSYLKENKFFYLKFISSTFQINPTQNNPVELIMTDEIFYTFIPDKYYSRSDFFIREAVVKEDKSIIPFISDKKVERLFQLFYEDIRTMQIFSSGTNQYGEIYLRLSRKITNIEKSYPKIDEFLAYVGGILKIAITGIGTFVITFNYYDLCLTIANRLYDFDQSQNTNQNGVFYENANQKILKLVEDVNYKQNHRNDVLDRQLRLMNNVKKYKLNGKNQFIEKLKERILQTRNNKLERLNSTDQLQKIQQIDEDLTENISYLKNRNTFLDFAFEELVKCKKILTIQIKYLVTRIFCRYIFYNDLEIQMIDTAVNVVKKDLDVVKMIDRFQAIENIKQILLTKNQINLFNSVPKPILTARNIKQEKLKKFNEKIKINNVDNFTYFTRMQNLFQAYEQLSKERDSKSQTKREKEMNKELFRMVGESLQQIFDFTLLLPKKVDKAPVKKINQIRNTFLVRKNKENLCLNLEVSNFDQTDEIKQQNNDLEDDAQQEQEPAQHVFTFKSYIRSHEELAPKLEKQ